MRARLGTAAHFCEATKCIPCSVSVERWRGEAPHWHLGPVPRVTLQSCKRLYKVSPQAAGGGPRGTRCVWGCACPALLRGTGSEDTGDTASKHPACYEPSCPNMCCAWISYRGTSLIRNCLLLRPYIGHIPRALQRSKRGGPFLMKEHPCRAPKVLSNPISCPSAVLRSTGATHTPRCC